MKTEQPAYIVHLVENRNCGKLSRVLALVFVFMNFIGQPTLAAHRTPDKSLFLPTQGKLLPKLSSPVPPELKLLAAPGWTIRSYQYGDLTGRNTKDAALVLAHNAVLDDIQDYASERKLIIAMRGADGRLQKEVDANSAVFNGMAPPYGSPDVSICQRRVILHHDAVRSQSYLQTRSQSLEFERLDGHWSLVNIKLRDHRSIDAKTTVNTINDITTGRVRTTFGDRQ